MALKRRDARALENSARTQIARQRIIREVLREAEIEDIARLPRPGHGEAHFSKAWGRGATGWSRHPNIRVETHPLVEHGRAMAEVPVVALSAMSAAHEFAARTGRAFGSPEPLPADLAAEIAQRAEFQEVATLRVMHRYDRAPETTVRMSVERARAEDLGEIAQLEAERRAVQMSVREGSAVALQVEDARWTIAPVTVAGRSPLPVGHVGMDVGEWGHIHYARTMRTLVALVARDGIVRF